MRKTLWIAVSIFAASFSYGANVQKINWQIFTEPFLLTKGGPGNATLTPVLVIYNKAFLNNDFGLASAWSLSLIIILGLFSAVYLRITRRAN